MKYDFERLPYQKRWLEWSGDMLRVANFSATGAGKTVMTIDWLNKINFRSILIVCPKSAMIPTWYDTLKDNIIHDVIMVCRGNKKKRQKMMEDYLMKGFKGAFIINYDVLDKHEFELSHMMFDCVVFDESHKLANATSARTKAALKLTHPENWGNARGVCILSGTPSPKDLMGYYTQMCLITGNQSKSFFAWRKESFDEHCVPGTCIKTYTPRRGVKERVLKSVAKLSFTATKDDLKQLPDRIRKVEAIPMNGRQKNAYDALLNDYVVALQDGTVIECDSNATRATKLLQVSSGFIYDADNNAHMLSENRTALMLDVLSTFDEGEQCIIWYAYKWQREQICKALKCESYSALSDKNKEKYVSDFVNGKNKYFVAHPRSCGESLTLTNCKYEIWYCLNGDLRGWMQAGDRIYRLGQNKNVLSVTLQSEDTYDEDVYNGIIRGFDKDKITMEFFRKKSK